jgi:hypothetical protein
MAAFPSNYFRPPPLLFLLLLFSGCSLEVASGKSFLAQVSEKEVDSSLQEELASITGQHRTSAGQRDRINDLKKALLPMFAALPKDGQGHLEHTVVRYALHRFFLQLHGWYIKGLEPGFDNSKKDELMDWVPSHVQEVIERRMGVRGFDLSELAVFAATLEDLIHGEAIKRLDGLLQVRGHSQSSAIDATEFDSILDDFTMIYLKGGKVSVNSIEDTDKQAGKFKKTYEGWREVREWVGDVAKNVTSTHEKDTSLDYNATCRVVESIGMQFGSFNDKECRDLKKQLLAIEDHRPARVPLSTFYRMGQHTHWSFTEKPDYLRALGALDETDSTNPAVIIPNYLSSRPQCLESSNFYAVCCRNLCEDLMTTLEQEVAGPVATVDQLSRLVASMTSDTVSAPRTLSDALLERLREVAEANRGMVPLHGRLFALWMHHAFPRDCPVPPKASTTNPQTPDEWMQATGAASTQASDAEVAYHTVGGAKVHASQSEVELPWTDTEELLTDVQSVGSISSESDVVGDKDIQAGQTEVHKEDIDASLREELAGKLRPGRTSEHLADLEAELRPMYDALPKNEAGRIGHATVRYAMHRLLSERYGWFVRGLEPDGDARSSSSSVGKKLKDWVPSYVQEAMERRSASNGGLDLAELAVFAATIEDLVHQESSRRLETIYELMQESPKTAPRLSMRMSEKIVDLFLMMYINGGDMEAHSADEASAMLEKFKATYTGWKEVSSWAREVWKKESQKVAAAPGQLAPLDFPLAAQVVESIGAQFGSFNDRECSELKSTLSAIEDRRPGRVRLSSFYKMGLHTHWQFTEKIEYLRAIGALDESVKDQPAVLLPNYLASRPNCLEASSIYAVCCRNECEDIISEIEREVSSPTATAGELIRLVSKISSSSVTAPRELSATLRGRLQEVAIKNGGYVPLHGRLFAQWIHHAFPRECPFPHEAGMTNPQTPDEWMEQTGQQSATATEEEMVCFTNGECGHVKSDRGSANLAASSVDNLPWSDAEVLLVDKPSTPVQKSPWSALSRALRFAVLTSAALGLTYLAKMAMEPRDDPAAKCKGQSTRGMLLTVALLLFPLAILSFDYIFDYDANEVFICCLCWGLGSMLLWSVGQRTTLKHTTQLRRENIFSGYV